MVGRVRSGAVIDLVLSSGWLAFARHCGFLAAVEDAGIEVGGVCGTSSGALAGALWLAGHSAAEVHDLLVEQAPLSWLRPSLLPWRGLTTADGMISRLRELVPPTFAELGRPLAVGVMEPSGGHALLSHGDLPRAVAASCAVPHLVRPVEIDGRGLRDGGAVDRTGLEAWRALRGSTEVVLHLVERSAGAVGAPPQAALVVRSPRSGAHLWSLGDTAAQLNETRAASFGVLERWLERR